jgi:hypothetical protein
MSASSVSASVITSTNIADFNLTSETFANTGFSNSNIVSVSGNITLDNALGVVTGVGDFTATAAYQNFFDGASNVGNTSFTTSTFGTVEFIGFISTAAFDRVEVREGDGSCNSDEFFEFYSA